MMNRVARAAREQQKADEAVDKSASPRSAGNDILLARGGTNEGEGSRVEVLHTGHRWGDGGEGEGGLRVAKKTVVRAGHGAPGSHNMYWYGAVVACCAPRNQ